MTEAWERWVGHTVDEQFPLRQYIGGSEHSAVFLTNYGDAQAVIKLVPVSREEATVQLSHAGSAAKLSHPHLLQVFHVGLCHLVQMSLLYFVMEHADEDLSQVVPQRALLASEAREILAPALAVLAYLHGEGFVHGHLKPANIFAVDNRVKLSGDSLCRIGDSDEALSPAEDVRSLGMTLLEVLTQRVEWPAALPDPFDDIVEHCLRQNPRRRWTIAQISERLNPAAARQHPSQQKWLYFAVPGLAVLLVAILAGPKLLQPRVEQPVLQPPPVTSEVAAPTKTVPAPASFKPAAEVVKAPIVTPLPVTSLPAGVVHRVLPEVPAKATSTIHGKLKMDLELSVDPSGSVLDAKLNPPVLSRYFGELALQAARGWKFEPTRVDGQDVPSKWLLRFEFERTETKVFPERITP